MLLTLTRRWADDDLVHCSQMNNPSPSADNTKRVYILRLWRADSAWRAALENPRTGERIGFENLERLFAYLMEQTELDATSNQERRFEP